MKDRLINVFFILMPIYFLVGCSSRITENEFEYSHTVLSPYVYIVKYTGTDDVVLVPARIGHYKVWGIKTGAFKDLANVSEITFLSDNPLAFSKNSFDNCPKLSKVNTRWTKPFKGAFKDCPKYIYQ
jgi:hypothetical protein